MLIGKSLRRLWPSAAVLALAAGAASPMFAGTGPAAAAGPPPVVLHASDDGTTTHLAVAQVVEVQLQEEHGPPGVSLTWSAASSDPAVLTMIGSHRVPPGTVQGTDTYFADFVAPANGQATITATSVHTCEALPNCPQSAPLHFYVIVGPVPAVVLREPDDGTTTNVTVGQVVEVQLHEQHGPPGISLTWTATTSDPTVLPMTGSHRGPSPTVGDIYFADFLASTNGQATITATGVRTCEAVIDCPQPAPLHFYIVVGPMASPTPCPAAPAVMNVHAQMALLGTQVSWDPPAFALGCHERVDAYAIYAFPQDPATGVVESLSNSYVYSGLKPNTYYTFTVIYFANGAWTTWSAWSPWYLVP